MKAKPLASAPATIASLFKERRIKGLDIQIKFSGMKFYCETEMGFKKILAKWALGTLVEASCFEREYDLSPYLVGHFVIDELTETNPAGEDASYDGTLSISGAPTTLDITKLDLLSTPVA